jgi:hypothetical protein
MHKAPSSSRNDVVVQDEELEEIVVGYVLYSLHE